MIRSMFDGVVLKKKEPCACFHSNFAVILSPSGRMLISFCDHCFNISNGMERGGYHMPPTFYVAQSAAWRSPTSMPASAKAVWLEGKSEWFSQELN